MRCRDVLALPGALALAGTGPAQVAAPPPKRARITSSVMLWTLKGTIDQKLEAAARAGLQSVELVAEHVSWPDAEIGRVKRLAASFGLGIDTIIATPDWTKRPVSMVDPAQRQNFLKDVQQAVTFARKLGVPYIILTSGNQIAGRSYEEQYASLLEGAKRAGELAANGNVTAIVEPLNSKVDHQGCFLTTCAEGLKLVKETDNPRVRLLFDIYHQQVQAGNVIRTIQEAAPWVAVFHVADNPGRNDPGTGEINYPSVYKAIQKTGYAGYITMEYLPLGDQVASLTQAVDQMRAALAG